MATFLYVSPYQTVTLLYSSTPICRAPMWDHYVRNDCIRACEHGCLKKISLGPLVVVDLFVFPLHLLSHIYSIFLYPHSSSHTSSALPWLSFLPSQVSAINHSETSHVRQLSQLSFSDISHTLREFNIATICYLYVLELAHVCSLIIDLRVEMAIFQAATRWKCAIVSWSTAVLPCHLAVAVAKSGWVLVEVDSWLSNGY